ncbi:hypothetical protein [Micromonospora wenchangensis]|uniref:SH3 domain-containing protein n=1 Tax=Micromonospora wenchangensis TaxID=1185415 RepID=A0A246RM28_9ACTN|nr:hypothetical protein [Micromonospora wenchangensis]OWV07503.1 hypothetical protein B5D80_14080 [Micromonospora wenchangensis]
MRSRLLSIASALTLAVSGSVLALIPASPASAHCDGHGQHPDLYSGGGISWGDGTFIRAYPHQDCQPKGQGYPNQNIDVHCATLTGDLWFFVRNTSTGINGWARRDALRFSQSVTIADCANGLAPHRVA